VTEELKAKLIALMEKWRDDSKAFTDAEYYRCQGKESAADDLEELIAASTEEGTKDE